MTKPKTKTHSGQTKTGLKINVLVGKQNKRSEPKRKVDDLMELLLQTSYPANHRIQDYTLALLSAGTINQREANWMDHTVSLYLINESKSSPTGRTYTTIMEFLEEFYPKLTHEERCYKARSMLIDWKNKPRWALRAGQQRYWLAKAAARKAAAKAKTKTRAKKVTNG